jgi:N-acetylglucosaminyl-diphospho-decaprenol L-rhamnosyltransferase
MTDGSIIIVTFNSAEHIVDCLDSLREDCASDRIKVIVVDNCSSDRTVEIIKQDFSWVTLIQSPYNGGFSAGINIGLCEASGDWRLILNPDTRLHPGTLSDLITSLMNRPDVGCIAPAILNQNGELIISTFAFSNLFTSIWYAFGLHHIITLNHVNQHPVWTPKTSIKSISEVDRVLGAVMLIRSEAINSIGMFDEMFFLYSEEEDYCHRLWDAGWKVVYNPEVKALHLGAGSTGIDNPIAQASADWSRYLYMRKHCGRLSAEISRFIWIVMLSLRLTCFTLFAGIKKSKNRIEGIKLSIRSLACPGYFERHLRPAKQSELLRVAR